MQRHALGYLERNRDERGLARHGGIGCQDVQEGQSRRAYELGRREASGEARRRIAHQDGLTERQRTAAASLGAAMCSDPGARPPRAAKDSPTKMAAGWDRSAPSMGTAVCCDPGPLR
jgi:hypothetical protein